MLCSWVLVVKCYAFFFKYITLVPLLDFISLMQLLWVFVSVECWTCKWYFAFKLISLHVRMFIPYVNEHCGHCFIVIACMVKPWFIALFHFAWSHCACFICITSFLHTMIKLYCCVSGDTCSYDSKASQILELGMSEFSSTVPNSRVKSRVCFRVLSQNSQRGRL